MPQIPDHLMKRPARAPGPNDPEQRAWAQITDGYTIEEVLDALDDRAKAARADEQAVEDAVREADREPVDFDVTVVDLQAVMSAGCPPVLPAGLWPGPEVEGARTYFGTLERAHQKGMEWRADTGEWNKPGSWPHMKAGWNTAKLTIVQCRPSPHRDDLEWVDALEAIADGRKFRPMNGHAPVRCTGVERRPDGLHVTGIFGGGKYSTPVNHNDEVRVLALPEQL